MLPYLDSARLQQNTLVIFLSDNNGAIDTDEQQTAWMPQTNPTSSNGWASVKCTPFRDWPTNPWDG